MGDKPPLADSTMEPLQQPAESSVIARVGDPPSFHTLAPPLTPIVLRVAATLVGMDDAEDAAQEAILRAWQHWGDLRDPAAARPWLLRITVNVCRQWRRGGFGARLRQTLPLTADQMELIAALDADPGASDYASALDLRAAVNHLPSQLRLIVALRYYGGMDASEIGAALGLPPSTIRTRLSRALGMLRERLGAREPVRPTTENVSQSEGGR